MRGYKPIALELDPIPQAILRPVRYPESKMLLLPAIQEKMAIFEGKFRITQDVTVSYDKAFIEAVINGPPSGTLLVLKGNLLYQACDVATRLTMYQFLGRSRSNLWIVRVRP